MRKGLGRRKKGKEENRRCEPLRGMEKSHVQTTIGQYKLIEMV